MFVHFVVELYNNNNKTEKLSQKPLEVGVFGLHAKGEGVNPNYVFTNSALLAE